MNFSQHKADERMDHAYDPVPGEPPVSPMPDYENGVPHSFFEYEVDNRLHYIMSQDQNLIPEDERPCPTPKHPNCSKDYWKPQVDLREEEEMRDPDWTPQNVTNNIYNKQNFKGSKSSYADQNMF
jgi:hypothetical protein